MKNSRLDKPRFIIGLAVVVMAVLLFLLTGITPPGIATIAVVGLITIATSRKRNRQDE